MSNEEKYVKVFTDTFAVDEAKAKQLEYQGIQQWDSVGHMGLVTALEEAFGVTMDTDDIIEFSSYEKGKEILASNYGIVF